MAKKFIFLGTECLRIDLEGFDKHINWRLL
jgi:hypothetical protein